MEPTSRNCSIESVTPFAANTIPSARRILSLPKGAVSVNRIKRYILFHNVRHSDEMGAAEVEAFLTHQGSQRECRCLHCHPLIGSLR